MSKNIFDGYLLLSDLDGTLVSGTVRIPEKNLQAIERFKALGGRFAIATGRNIVSSTRYHKIVQFNSPSIILNGGAIYDYSNEKFINEEFINKGLAKEIALKILEKFPEVGLEIYTDREINIIKRNEVVDYHINLEPNNYNYCTIDEVTKPWYKVFFGMDEKIQSEVKAYGESISSDEVKWIVSWKKYLELLPASSCKGNAFNKLIEYLGIEKGKACAIGDYYNDLDLLQVADISAVPDNAPDDMKAIADVVVCNCDIGAVAEFIEYLEKKIEVQKTCRK